MNYSRQLTEIMVKANWTQEELARQLTVSFPTLNSWINERSRPRQKALQKINRLYLDVVGAPAVDQVELDATKQAVQALPMNAQQLLGNKAALEMLTLHLTYHTNTIEGSTMTLSDVQDVLFEQAVLANRTAIEQAEARNHQAALYWLLDEMVRQGSSFAVTEEILLGLHLRLMNGIIGDAGQYRKHAVRIMGARVPLANWQKVPNATVQLLATLQRPSGDIVVDMAQSHAVFEQIHPFSDGNGRCGRLLVLAQAMQAGVMPPLVLKERKHAYYKYLEIAQLKAEYRPLQLYLAQSMQACNDLLQSNLDEAYKRLDKTLKEMQEQAAPILQKLGLETDDDIAEYIKS